MIPGEYNIEIFRGGTFGFDALATDDQGVINFLTTYTSARMHIRPAWIKQATSAAPLLELTTENGRLELTTNSVNIEIDSLATSGLTFNKGVYSLELVIAGTPEIVDIMIYGKVTVQGEITK